jgi:hypothetical protein
MIALHSQADLLEIVAALDAYSSFANVSYLSQKYTCGKVNYAHNDHHSHDLTHDTYLLRLKFPS